MSKTWIIFKREYAEVVKKKSFIVGILLTPLLMVGFTLLPAWLGTRDSDESQRLAVVDQSGGGLGRDLAAELGEYTLDDGETPYYIVDGVFDVAPDDHDRFAAVEDSLRTAINNDEIKYVIVFRPGVIEVPDSVYVVTNSESFRTINRFERVVSKLLSTRRLQASEINLSIDSVLALTGEVSLRIEDAKGESIPFIVKYFAALVFVLLVFGMILGYGQQVMRSVIEEKNSRIMEVLMSSVSPFQLMMGKILGLGGAALSQVAIWVLIGVGILFMGQTMAIDPSVSSIVFNPMIVIFFVLFLVFGYLMFSSLFAFIGSIVTTDKEAQSLVPMVSIILIAPVMIAIYTIQQPNSVLAITMSMIPFVAPTMTVMRIVFMAPTATEYSLFSGILGQSILSLALVILATLLVIWITSRVFRIGILMYGKRATLPEIIKWVRR